MTTVNMNREAAETVTVEIREAGKTLATARTKFASAVKRAKDGNAHKALGFKSWTEYVATVFADLPGLAKGDHEYLTAFMAGEGMSSRAVARVLGISQSTANRMVAALEAKGEVSEDRKVTGTDGKAQAKGKGKGRAKGKGKTAETPATEEPRDINIKTEKSDVLKGLALQILAELSDRWEEGDESAEIAMREIADAALVTA